MEQIVLILLNGAVYGLLLFMLSSGLTLIYGMMGVLNLAHASFYMLGAFLGFTISVRVGFWPGLVLAPAGGGGAGGGGGAVGAADGASAWACGGAAVHVGLAFVINEVVPLVWGRTPVPYKVPAALDFPLFAIAGNAYPAYRLFMMGVAVAMFLALFATLARTRLGLVIRRR